VVPPRNFPLGHVRQRYCNLPLYESETGGKNFAMPSFLPSSLIRIIILSALLTQSLVGGTMARAQSGWGYLLCQPSGQSLSPEMQAQLKEISAILDIAEPEDAASQHCGDCVIAHFALQTKKQEVPAGLWAATTHVPLPIHDAGFLLPARGPPLGGRAPPVKIPTPV